MRGARGARKGDPSVDEVEEMLRAAEDDLLLNLTRDSHSTARRLESPSFPASLLSSSSYSPSPLDADLAARFDALKFPTAPSRAKQPKSAAAPAASAPPSHPSVAPKDRVTAAECDGGGEDEWSAILGDDLNARFKTLKGASSVATVGSKPDPAMNHKKVLLERSKEDGSDGIRGGAGVSESEVEKVLQWAMDAARLEPSSIKAGDGNNTDEDDEEEEDEEDSDSEDDDDKKGKKPSGTKTQGKANRPKKWLFF